MQRFLSPSNAERYASAAAHYYRGELAKAAVLSERLAKDGHEPAHFLLGMMYEFGGNGVRVDLAKAVSHYRCAARGLRNADTERSLVRASGKLSQEEASGDSPAWARPRSSRVAWRGRLLGFAFVLLMRRTLPPQAR